jgi:hypothetical protein
MILSQRDAQFGGDFFLARTSAQSLLQRCDGGFQVAAQAAALARRPIQASQSIQNGSPDAVFRVRFQFDVLGRVVMVNCGDQPKGACGDQVIHADGCRQPFMNSPGDEAHLGQMLQNEAFALLRGGRKVARVHGSGSFRGGRSGVRAHAADLRVLRAP